jgi:hypothetical protein
VHNRQGGAAYSYSFGVEQVERLNDEAYTYVTNLLTTSGARSEDALLSTLLKGRGRLDTFCCKALKDLLSLCVKDQDIARFVYRTAPPTYQYARYSDWFRGYIEGQKSELDNTNMSTYSYYQNRIIAVNKAYDLLEKFE